MDEQLKSNLTSSKHWIRLIYMVLFAVLLQLALGVMWVLVVVQFLFALITGNDNQNLRTFCDSLSQYIYNAIRFITYNSDEKPYPFSDWPEASAVDEPADVTPEAVTPEAVSPEVVAPEEVAPVAEPAAQPQDENTAQESEPDKDNDSEKPTADKTEN